MTQADIYDLFAAHSRLFEEHRLIYANAILWSLIEDCRTTEEDPASH